MKILNKKILNDLKEGKLLSLNLGSGFENHEDFYNVDINEELGVDIVADLNFPLDLIPENSVCNIYSNQTFEHIENLFGLLSEIYRISSNGGKCEIIVPHFSNPYYYSDPTHVRQFGLFSMHYFTSENYQWRRKVPSYYSDTKFILRDAKIIFYKDTLIDHLFANILSPLVNLTRAFQHIFEKRFSWFYPPANIKFILEISK